MLDFKEKTSLLHELELSRESGVYENIFTEDELEYVINLIEDDIENGID